MVGSRWFRLIVVVTDDAVACRRASVSSTRVGVSPCVRHCRSTAASRTRRGITRTASTCTDDSASNSARVSTSSIVTMRCRVMHKKRAVGYYGMGP